MSLQNTTLLDVFKLDGAKGGSRRDVVAVEEPLEIRVGKTSLAVTMRTPGHDFELAAGFLFNEGVIRTSADILKIGYCEAEPQQYNIVTVELSGKAAFDLKRLERHFFTTSACGVCGKAALETLAIHSKVVHSKFRIDIETLYSLDAKLRGKQSVFERTGALHAAAVFDGVGELVLVREDVGRHNAVDKAVGAALLEGKLPLDRHVLMVSGRSSFEILQKALMARIPVVASVGGPSSLAVEVAKEFGITLVSFLRGRRCNVYTSRERIRMGKK